jgi:hypothetical protein
MIDDLSSTLYSLILALPTKKEQKSNQDKKQKGKELTLFALPIHHQPIDPQSYPQIGQVL